MSSLGSFAIAEWQGWIRGQFAVNHPREVFIQCLVSITAVFAVFNRRLDSVVISTRGVGYMSMRMALSLHMFFAVPWWDTAMWCMACRGAGTTLRVSRWSSAHTREHIWRRGVLVADQVGTGNSYDLCPYPSHRERVSST